MPKCKQCGTSVSIWKADLAGDNLCPDCRNKLVVESQAAAKAIAESQAVAKAKTFELPPIEDSAVASFLTFIGALELIASPIAGLGIGSENTLTGWMVFLSGFISGFLFLGFARVIHNTLHSSQRLHRIEMLIQKRFDDEKSDA